MHKNRRLNGISDFEHLFKRIDLNDLISMRLEEIVDLLDIRLILRLNLLDTCGIRNIGRSGETDKRYQKQDHQTIKHAKHDCGGLECLTTHTAGTSDHFRFSLGNGRGHFNIDRFRRQRYTKLGSIGIYRTSRKGITVTENIDLERQDNVARGIRQRIRFKKLIGKVVVFVVINYNDLVDPQIFCTVL